MTSVPDITRMLARIAEWQEGHGTAGGRAETARRLDEAHKLLDEVANMLTDMRRDCWASGDFAARPRKGCLLPTGAQKEGRNQHGAALKVILSAAGSTDRRAILRAAGAKDYLGSTSGREVPACLPTLYQARSVPPAWPRPAVFVCRQLAAMTGIGAILPTT